jgi:HlyD family secretion protein
VGYQLIFASSVSTFRTEKDKLSIAGVTAGKFDDYITINGNVAPITTIFMDAYEGGRVTEKLIEEDIDKVQASLKEVDEAFK